MTALEIEYGWDEEIAKEPKIIVPKKVSMTKIDQRVQYEGRFLIREEMPYFRSNNGKEFVVEGTSSRYLKLLGQEVMITAILRNSSAKKPIIRVLSFI